MSGSKVNKAELLELARALGDEIVDNEETVPCIFARCLERARELGQPVHLYTKETHPIVAEWARLVLDDARRYEGECRSALEAWEVKPTTKALDPVVAAEMRRANLEPASQRWRWIEMHLQRAAEIVDDDEEADREEHARRQDLMVNHCLHTHCDGTSLECPDCGQSLRAVVEEDRQRFEGRCEELGR